MPQPRRIKHPAELKTDRASLIKIETGIQVSKLFSAAGMHSLTQRSARGNSLRHFKSAYSLLSSRLQKVLLLTPEFSDARVSVWPTRESNCLTR